MVQSITFPKNPPRDPNRYSIQLRKGLVPYYFFGIFFLVAPFFPLFFYLVFESLYNSTGVTFIVPLIVFAGIGLLLLTKGHRKVTSRKHAFMNGMGITGAVIRQGRAFAFWKSSRDYAVTVEYRDASGEKEQAILISGSRELYDALPVGTKIIGFYDTGTDSVFFPAEIGVHCILT